MAEATYTTILDALAVRVSIGIHDAERAAAQPMTIGVSMTCRYPAPPEDAIGAVVDYDFLRTGILALVAGRHFELQETLCDAVAALALADDRVVRVAVRTMKTDIYPDAAIGCEVVRERLRT